MKNIMVQGTASGAGKSVITAALCRIFSDMGYAVAPFKSQNMSRYSYTIPGQEGLEISSAQAVQAAAARCEITASLNPILLKPEGWSEGEGSQRRRSSSAIYVEGRPYGVMDPGRYYNEFALSDGLAAASAALKSLIERFDIVILEGAGSPAEINLARYDIANMRMAHMAGDAPVIIACDIDRGGAFASLAGTMALLPDDDARLVEGFVLNKFRGDVSVLEPGYGELYDMTGVPVIGTVPMLDLSDLPDEDSLDSRPGTPIWDAGAVPEHIERGLRKLARDARTHLDVDAILEMTAER